MTINGYDMATGYQPNLDPDKTNGNFVFIKTSDGLSTEYAKGWQTVANSDTFKNGTKGLALYHYAYLDNNDAKTEANFWYNVVRDYVGKAGFALDFEAGSLNASVAKTKEFLDEFTRLSGVRPWIYMSKSTTNDRDWSSVAKDYGLWGAQYANYNETGFQTDPWTDSNSWGAWGTPSIFQYSSSGKLSGYSGKVDLDLFYGSLDDFKKFYLKSSAKPLPSSRPSNNTSAIQTFKNSNNGFTMTKAFQVDAMKFVNGVWQIINYNLAGGKDAGFILNGIPLDLLDNVSRGNSAPTQIGDWVKFSSGWDRGTIDKYDISSNGIGIEYGKFGIIWFNADSALAL